MPIADQGSPDAQPRLPTPSLGRIVHYVDPQPPHFHRTAIISGVWVDAPGSRQVVRVDLHVFVPNGVKALEDVPFNGDLAAEQPGSWHWPEYVP